MFKTDTFKSTVAAKRFLSLLQGLHSVAEFSVEFRTVAAESGWNTEALQGVFIKGLSEQIKDELAARDDPASLDTFISLAIRIDSCLHERRRERASHQFSTPAPLPSSQSSTSHSPAHVPAPCANPTSHTHSYPEEKPMQLGWARLLPAERLWRMQASECIYCGNKGSLPRHLSPAAKRVGSPVTLGILVGQTTSSSSSNSRSSSRPCYAGINSLPLITLVDSGMDEKLLRRQTCCTSWISEGTPDCPHQC